MFPSPSADPTTRLRECVANLPASAGPAILTLAADLPPLYVDRLCAAVDAVDEAVTAEMLDECEQVLQRVLRRLGQLAPAVEAIWRQEQERVLTRS
ncbi:MAG TPA: hypothetical protein VK066_12270 [Chloroflexota bacterium]|nr:hypothetical protein [Chloroflexota bacterium]